MQIPACTNRLGVPVFRDSVALDPGEDDLQDYGGVHNNHNAQDKRLEFVPGQPQNGDAERRFGPHDGQDGGSAPDAATPERDPRQVLGRDVAEVFAKPLVDDSLASSGHLHEGDLDGVHQHP